VSRKAVLFVCIGNTCRSQMAEALARHAASDVIDPASAGLTPFGEIVAPTRVVLEEIGVGIDGQTSKPLRKSATEAADLIINLTGRPGETAFAACRQKVEDWEVGDPYGEDLEVYRRIRDEIAGRVSGLAERLRAEKSATTDS
jgi:protein-tyrosine-phosphatase